MREFFSAIYYENPDQFLEESYKWVPLELFTLGFVYPVIFHLIKISAS
jgi:hypothetical protein